MDSNDKYVGRILDNRYEILERIGTGGMALVYKARCHRLNRLVAIKILKEDLASDEEFRRRFHTESQAVAMLSHPNIVAVYDVSRSDATEYIVMELIDGITLKQYINRKGLLNWKEALHFATQITKALSHAHSRGIIHRDIKPHNIMILKDGSVKVADFGIARLLTMQNTLTQEALGSVHYISPEQAKGGHMDARSDIYSVGVVMYEMLTSRLPFVGDSAVSVAIQHISAIPLMPRDINQDIPTGLEDITMRAMEPDINLRFTTADEMLADLEEFRKNPAIEFNYAVSGPNKRPPDDEDDIIVMDRQATRPIPSAALVNVERPVPAKRPTAKKPEMTRTEYRNVHKRASKTSTLVGVLIIVVFLIVVVAFMWNSLLKPIIDPDMITIPNFVGREYDNIERDSELKQIYSFTPTYENSDEFAEGLVVSQNPSAERQHARAQGRTIEVRLVVSLGERPPDAPVQMPDLINKRYNEAYNQLMNLGLDLDVELQPVPDEKVTEDYIIETIPAEGSVLARGNMIIIRYSAGPEVQMVMIPDMVGRTQEALQAEFDRILLVADYTYYPDEREAGTVIFISRIGVEVPAHTKVGVHVSKGPPETPPPTDTTQTDDPPPQLPPVDDPLPQLPGDTEVWDPVDTAEP